MTAYRWRPLASDDALEGPRLALTRGVVDGIVAQLPKRVEGTDHENVLYVLGLAEDSQSVGCALVAPNARTTPRSYDTDANSHAAVVDLLGETDLQVVAQVHSHPGSAVYHSDGDDDLAFILAEGFWSLVVPDYGRSGFLPLQRIGFHCYTGGEFRLLTARAVEARVRVVPDFTNQARP